MPKSLPGASISFPMLGGFTINPPSSFSLGPLTIHWYGVIIATGFLLAVLYCAKRAPEFGMTADDVFNVILLGVPLAIICARIYYVAFEWDSYKDDLLSVLYIWEGGLGMYGVIFGAVLATVIYCAKKKLNFPAFLDMVCFGFLIGQFVGRWGNFMNREAFGYETDIFCRMVLTTPSGVQYAVHPTFLYESLWNFTGFILMHLWSKKHRTFDGEMILTYFAWYGCGRMFIEGLRTDSLMIGNTGIRVSQLVSFILLLASLSIILYNRLKRHPDPANMFVNRRRAAMAGAVEIVGTGDGDAEKAAEEPEKPGEDEKDPGEERGGEGHG